MTLNIKSILLLLLIGNVSFGDTFEQNFFYDDADGSNPGGNLTVDQFDYVYSITSGEGIVFHATVRLMAMKNGIAANLRTNGGTSDREFGVQATAGGDNGAIEPGESVIATLEDITVTDFNGFDPGDVTVTFDGFTNIILYFVGNDGDSAEVTDGDGLLIFEFNGTLDPLENGGVPDTNDDSLFEFGVMGESGTSANNARIDVSGVMPQSLIISGTDFSGMGVPTEPNNRVRVDDFGAQFTVEVKTDFVLGDVNCDGIVDLLDVAPFVELLTMGGFNAKADINQDGFVDLLDVSPFVDLLIGG